MTLMPNFMPSSTLDALGRDNLRLFSRWSFA